MKQKLQVVENYITKYDFKIKRKILSNEELSIDFGVGYKILKVFEKKDRKLVSVNLNNIIILKSNNDEVGNIDTNIYGLFEFESEISEKEFKKIIRKEGSIILYHQLRAYISANTALSQCIPTINLPIITFINNLEK